MGQMVERGEADHRAYTTRRIIVPKQARAYMRMSAEIVKATTLSNLHLKHIDLQVQFKATFDQPHTHPIWS